MVLVKRVRTIAGHPVDSLTRKDRSDIHALCNWAEEARAVLEHLMKEGFKPAERERIAKLLGAP